MFLLEIDEFKKIPQYGFQLSCARKIFNKYIHSAGVMPVPVTSRTRVDMEAAIRMQDISQSLFAKAAAEVFEYIEHKQFPRCVIFACCLLSLFFLILSVDLCYLPTRLIFSCC